MHMWVVRYAPMQHGGGRLQRETGAAVCELVAMAAGVLSVPCLVFWEALGVLLVGVTLIATSVTLGLRTRRD